MEDLISRDEVLSAINFVNENNGFDSNTDYSLLLKTINELPSVNPQPKIGHWIRWYEQKEIEWFIENIPRCKCSECGKEYDPHSSQFIKYCNECGAKMESEVSNK